LPRLHRRFSFFQNVIDSFLAKRSATEISVHYIFNRKNC